MARAGAHVRLRPTLGILPIAVALLAGVGHAMGHKNKEPPAPIVGWHTEEGWAFACYYPPDFGSMQTIDRRMARSKVLTAIESQWRGERDDGVRMPAKVVDDLDTILLGRPEQIEGVAQKNLEQCKQAATSGGGTDAWVSWLRGLPRQLTAGECLTPFDYTMFDYLDIGTGWQRTLPICKGDKIEITGSVKDRYRLSEGGPWINVEGDPAQPTAGNQDYPCNQEGCLAGMLIMRFVSDDGVELIIPVGSDKIFTAPENGKISYRINDTTFYDNTWHKSGGIIDHTSVQIAPVK